MAAVEGSMTPESIALWQEKIQPLLAALREHTTVEQLRQLRDEARGDTEAPIAVVNILDVLHLMRMEIERL